MRSQSAPPESLQAQVDALLSPVFKAGTPGAALLVMKDGKPLLRKAYGTADLELGVPMTPEHVFRIGSLTKQFTAVAILMLMEQGKLALNDPLTKFLPDYPVQGKTVTVEHLLTHTSGIKSVTDIPEWIPLQRKDMTLTELIALFKDKPFDFEPGERWLYNNSGYVLLGAIIEKVAGTSYEAFLQKNIFDPLGLKNTHYDSATRIIHGRIPGYAPGADSGFQNAEYLSMTQPYAAGSLLSTVDDLAAWNEALLAGKLVRPETLKRAWTPHRLADGTSTGYGYGWGIGRFENMITHSGGIHGFTSDGILFPEDRLVVIMLTNSAVPARAPGRFTPRIAGLALGRTYTDPKAVAVAAEALTPLAGVYANRWKEELSVWVDGTRVQVAGPNQGRTTVQPLSQDLFFPPGSPARVEFKRDAEGLPLEVTMKPGLGPEVRYVRTAKPLAAEKKAVAIDPKIFDQYAGDYELQPGFVIKFFRQGDKLMTQATGQAAFEIFAESETKFFLKVVDGSVEFVKDASGKVTGMVLNQSGRSMPAKRIEK